MATVGHRHRQSDADRHRLRRPIRSRKNDAVRLADRERRCGAAFLMVDIVCLGEALIDLVPTVSGIGLAAAETFVKAAGGAPANVAVAAARLGVASAFLGMVGDEPFGHFLADTLAAAGVGITGLRFTKGAPTALAAVSLQADGERDFVFYGSPAAHSLYAPEDVDEPLLRGAEFLHVGSISLIGDPARAATLHAVDIARRCDVRVSYDPNLRRPLWPDDESARNGLRLGLAHADIVKISVEEVAFLAGSSDLVAAARSLWHPRLQLMAVTRGAAGCVWLTADAHGEVAGFDVTAVDTTGAGDAFTGALLAELAVGHKVLGDSEGLARVMRFANAAGALTTTRRGAIPALPDRATVERFLGERGCT